MAETSHTNGVAEASDPLGAALRQLRAVLDRLPQPE